MEMKAADFKELEGVMNFYNDLIDSMRDAEYKPAWEKGIYPAEQFIKDSIKQRELFIGMQDNRVVSAMILNSNYAEGYDKVDWKIKAEKNEIIIIHTLGVSPLCQGQGIAKKMLDFAVEFGREKRMKTIRLDVLSSNLPAQKLYPAVGFSYIDTVKLFYEDTGLTEFLLYEFVL